MFSFSAMRNMITTHGVQLDTLLHLSNTADANFYSITTLAYATFLAIPRLSTLHCMFFSEIGKLTFGTSLIMFNAMDVLTERVNLYLSL